MWAEPISINQLNSSNYRSNSKSHQNRKKKLIVKYEMRRSNWMNMRSNLIRSEMWRCRERNGEWFLERERGRERYREGKIEKKQRERSCRLLKTERKGGCKGKSKDTAPYTQEYINIYTLSRYQFISNFWNLNNFMKYMNLDLIF